MRRPARSAACATAAGPAARPRPKPPSPLPRRARERVAEREQSADDVRSDRGERPARRADGLAHRVAIKREQVKEILRQLFPRQLLAIEKIAEHQDDVALGGALAGRGPIYRRRG